MELPWISRVECRASLILAPDLSLLSFAWKNGTDTFEIHRQATWIFPGNFRFEPTLKNHCKSRGVCVCVCVCVWSIPYRPNFWWFFPTKLHWAKLLLSLQLFFLLKEIERDLYESLILDAWLFCPLLVMVWVSSRGCNLNAIVFKVCRCPLVGVGGWSQGSDRCRLSVTVSPRNHVSQGLPISIFRVESGTSTIWQRDIHRVEVTVRRLKQLGRECPLALFSIFASHFHFYVPDRKSGKIWKNSEISQILCQFGKICFLKAG
jgi:hypothetical protein